MGTVLLYNQFLTGQETRTLDLLLVLHSSAPHLTHG